MSPIEEPRSRDAAFSHSGNDKQRRRDDQPIAASPLRFAHSYG
jgi:hypothetical protein